MKKIKDKAAQELGRKSHIKRTAGFSKKQVSEYYRKIAEKRWKIRTKLAVHKPLVISERLQ